MSDTNLKVQIDGYVVSIDLSEFPIDQSTLLERIEEITPILASILTADLARSRLDDDLYEKLMSAIMAKDLTYQIILYRAKLEAEAMLAITEQRLRASDVGFPEFDGSINLDD